MFLKSDAILLLKKGFIAFEIIAITGNNLMAIDLFLRDLDTLARSIDKIEDP